MRFFTRHQPPPKIEALAPADDLPFIRLEAVTRAYQTGRGILTALTPTDLAIEAGESVAIVGPSGSGKSTILNVIAGIDRPSAGRILVGGVELTTLSEERLTRWRGEHVGIVFQFFQLMPTLSALENVLLASEFRGSVIGGGWRRRRALELLEEVGLADLVDHLPAELSGGEQQRVALARALVNNPPLLLADEPTGNLDSSTGERIMALLADFAGGDRTLIFVTHDPILAARARRIIRVRDGAIASDERTEKPAQPAGAMVAAHSDDATLAERISGHR
ncbi:MAG TPA: ABC transporter ATP-binding protein [Thermomicrobiales bacterium]|jgi:putative ABC transport system ATP-binding protein